MGRRRPGDRGMHDAAGHPQASARQAHGGGRCRRRGSRIVRARLPGRDILERRGAVREPARRRDLHRDPDAVPHRARSPRPRAWQARRHRKADGAQSRRCRPDDPGGRGARRQLVVGHSHSFEPPIRKIREIAQSGALGRVRMLHNWCFTDWLYRPRNTEELDTRLGGGVTFRQGSHQFDILRFIGGGLLRSVRAMTGHGDPQRPTEDAHVAYMEFEDGTPASAVYSGADHFHTTELAFGIGEQGQPVDPAAYGRARQTLQRVGGRDAELGLKRAVRYGGSRAPRPAGPAPHPPFFVLTLVSCEKGDIRQSARGVYVYGKNERREVPLSTEDTGRDAVVRELYDAVVNARAPLHGGRWGKA